MLSTVDLRPRSVERLLDLTLVTAVALTCHIEADEGTDPWQAAQDACENAKARNSGLVLITEVLPVIDDFLLLFWRHLFPLVIMLTKDISRFHDEVEQVMRCFDMIVCSLMLIFNILIIAIRPHHVANEALPLLGSLSILGISVLLHVLFHALDGVIHITGYVF